MLPMNSSHLIDDFGRGRIKVPWAWKDRRACSAPPYHKLVQHMAGVDNEIFRSLGKSLESKVKGIIRCQKQSQPRSDPRVKLAKQMPNGTLV